jgi:hypothetical protein
MVVVASWVNCVKQLVHESQFGYATCENPTQVLKCEEIILITPSKFVIPSFHVLL